MSDEPALLAAILAHPDEDTPRLIYADWLQENGQPERAEFIRLQFIHEFEWTAEQAQRHEHLEEKYRGRWFVGLPQFLGTRWVFCRGFPEFLSTSVELFLERYEAFTRVGWLRFLSFHELDSSAVRDFLNRDWNPRWAELELQAYWEEEVVRVVGAIANCPQMRQLRRLHLSCFGLNFGEIEALVASPHLDNLAQLQIDGARDDPRFAPLRERFGDRLVIG